MQNKILILKYLKCLKFCHFESFRRRMYNFILHLHKFDVEKCEKKEEEKKMSLNKTTCFSEHTIFYQFEEIIFDWKTVHFIRLNLLGLISKYSSENQT